MSITLVKMVRDTPLQVSGPTTADVHPNEVQGWMSCGWVLDKSVEIVKEKEGDPPVEVTPEVPAPPPLPIKPNVSRKRK